MKEHKINIYEQVGGENAVSVDDGEKVFKLIKKAIDENLKIILDFNNIKLLSTLFLNAAVGQLYGNYDEIKVKEFLSLNNLSQLHLETLKRVVDRAKEYFKDKQKFDEIAKNSLGDE
jgi:hypothetical protein